MPLKLINVLFPFIYWNNNKIDIIIVIISMKIKWDDALKVISILPETVVIQQMKVIQ